MVRSGAHRTGIAGAAFNRLADSVATVDTRGHVYAFHIRKNRYQLLAREGDEGTAVAITDKEVFAGFINGVIKIYDQDKGAVVATLKGHRSRVTHVEVSPGGDYLLSSSNDSVFLWDLTSPSYAKRALSGGAYGAVQAKFAGPTGDKVVVAFHDESLWVWVTDSGELLFKLDPPRPRRAIPIHGPTLCQSICISPDARHVITAGGSPCLFVWDLEARALSHAVELPQPTQHASDVQSLPGGNFVAVVCDDGAVRIVDPFKGAVTHTMVVGDEMHGGKEKMAEVCAWSRRDDAELSSPRKGQMRLYDLHHWRAQKQKEHPVHLKSIPISADVGERTIASGEVAGPGSAGDPSGGYCAEEECTIEGAPGCGVPSVDPASVHRRVTSLSPSLRRVRRPLRGVLHRDKSTSWARDAADRCLASRRLLGIVRTPRRTSRCRAVIFWMIQTQIPPRLTSPNCATCCTPTENSRRSIAC